MAKPRVVVRRIYELDPDEQGTRVLVDRLWPRGWRRLVTATKEPEISQTAVLADLLS